MSNRTSNHACRLRLLFAPALLLAGAVAHGQAVNVTAANASNDAIYSVTFSGSSGSTTVLNTDGGSLHHLTSLVFLTNTNAQSYQLDLLAADNQGGLIVRYPGDFHTGPGPSTPVFQFNGGAGPAYPDGLSVDAQWDLFVVNSKPGSSSNPQLWVFPTDGAGGFTTPQLLDSNYSSSEVLEETLVVGTTVTPQGGQPVLFPGDVLVLTSNPSYVLRYASPGANGNGPLSGPVIPTILITLPTGSNPGGMAFLPDNSLLITDSRGTITQYQFTSSGITSTTWAQGLGNGQFKIKTGLQSGVPYAYVANNNGGEILQFGAGGGSPIAVVTSGVQHPQGLAVTNTNYASITTCENNLCDILGGGQNGNPGVIRHNVGSLSLTGNVLEKVCVVPVDPRLVPPSNSCTTSLSVATVCPGFADNVVIPALLCGGSGSSGKGFALVETLTQAYVQGGFPFNGGLVYSDSHTESVLPGVDLACNVPAANTGPSPVGTLAWAPLANEGIVVEGNNMLEATSNCDEAGSTRHGLSLFGLGFALNVPDLVAFTNTKYTTLAQTFSNVNGNGELDEKVLAAASPPSPQLPDGNTTYQLQQCIATSQQAFSLKNPAYYDGVAQDLLTADLIVANHATDPTVFLKQDSDYPNPSGALRERLENMYYTINTRIDLQLASPTTFPKPNPTAPTIANSPITKVLAGTLYQFQPQAHDFAHTVATQPPPPNNLTFSIVAPPSFLAWASLNQTTGLLSGTAVKGNYSNIQITVTDGCASSTLTFNLKVN